MFEFTVKPHIQHAIACQETYCGLSAHYGGQHWTCSHTFKFDDEAAHRAYMHILDIQIPSIKASNVGELKAEMGRVCNEAWTRANQVKKE